MTCPKTLLPLPQKRKDSNSLKHKFYLLANTKAKIGDPNIPPSVLKEKSILCDIVEGKDGLSGSPHFAASDSFLDESDFDDKEDAEDKELADLPDATV